MKFLEQILILLLLFQILKISHNNEITIKIKGNGEQKILSDKYENELPYEIIINNKEEFYTNNTIDLDEQLNNITLKWHENQLTNSSKMFEELTNIIEFDFSKFDSLNIIDMSYMFLNCSSLKYLNLTNFNRSKVTNMNLMFKGCD